MKSNFLGELLISIVLILLVVLLTNPLDFWMPQPIHMGAIFALAILFILFAVFVWRENVKDERESLHRYIAARFAYIAGTATLVLGVILQSLKHIVDAWLVIVLVIMILAKIVGRIYSQQKH